ncbi:MAG: class I SAM-dependent methyltransferase [Desulfobacterales bacterium]|nr:class I SAM-dependent methyltransferase [Desulfobacterales bacterium]
MDYARSMIEANMLTHKDPRVYFKCAHVMDMPFERHTFDSVICFACFPHFQDQKGAAKKIAHVLKPGGRLTIGHLMSSEEISGHHNTETAVSNDRLPTIELFESWFLELGLEVIKFSDKPGFYCLTVIKSGKTES